MFLLFHIGNAVMIGGSLIGLISVQFDWMSSINLQWNKSNRQSTKYQEKKKLINPLAGWVALAGMISLIQLNSNSDFELSFINWIQPNNQPISGQSSLNQIQLPLIWFAAFFSFWIMVPDESLHYQVATNIIS